MFRLLIMELRDIKGILVLMAIGMVAMNIIIRLLLDIGGEFYFAIFGMVASLVLVYLPALMLQVHVLQAGNKGLFATNASLPISRSRLAVSRYLAPACVHLAVGTLVIVSGILGTDTLNAQVVSEIISSGLNRILVGLSVMALCFLIVNFFPKTASMIGYFGFIAVTLLLRAAPFRWLWYHISSPSFIAPLLAFTLVIVIAEVKLFSLQASRLH